jgi:hypothetical protein
MGPTSEVWLEAARRHGAVIVAGICERAGDALYNSLNDRLSQPPKLRKKR